MTAENERLYSTKRSVDCFQDRRTMDNPLTNRTVNKVKD